RLCRTGVISIHIGTPLPYVTRHIVDPQLVRSLPTNFLCHSSRIRVIPGLPLEIYAFSRDTSWVNYESLQSDIFDHIFATLPHFDLRIFQNPSGNDLRAMGDLLVGKRQGHEQDNSEELSTESRQLNAEQDT
ncbi:hypothetical protein LH53_09380, partial [Mesotoga sp. TolDC]